MNSSICTIINNVYDDSGDGDGGGGDGGGGGSYGDDVYAPKR